MLKIRGTSCPSALASSPPRLLVGAVLLLAASATAQNAGSNITGITGLIAIDKLGDKLRFAPATFTERTPSIL